jgi:hypothetical protein
MLGIIPTHLIMLATCHTYAGGHSATTEKNQLNSLSKIGSYYGLIPKYGASEDVQEMPMPSPVSIQNYPGAMAIVLWSPEENNAKWHSN